MFCSRFPVQKRGCDRYLCSEYCVEPCTNIHACNIEHESSDTCSSEMLLVMHSVMVWVIARSNRRTVNPD